MNLVRVKAPLKEMFIDYQVSWDRCGRRFSAVELQLF